MSKTSKSQKGRESPGEPGRARTESPGETGIPAFSPRALRDRGGKAGNPVFSPRALYICYRSVSEAGPTQGALLFLLLSHQQAPSGPALQDSTTSALYRAPLPLVESF
jgi:hypothetical protein